MLPARNQVFDYRPFKAGALIPAGYDISPRNTTRPAARTVDFPRSASPFPTRRRRSVGFRERRDGRPQFCDPAQRSDYASPPGELEFGADAELVMLMPHMHLRGKDMT